MTQSELDSLTAELPPQVQSLFRETAHGYAELDETELETVLKTFAKDKQKRIKTVLRLISNECNITDEVAQSSKPKAEKENRFLAMMKRMTRRKSI